MPEMTATPILLPALAPANPGQGSGKPTPTENARLSATAPTAPINEAGVVQSDGTESFARVLQRQLAQPPAQPVPVDPQTLLPAALMTLDLALDPATQPGLLAVTDPAAQLTTDAESGLKPDAKSSLATAGLFDLASQAADRSAKPVDDDRKETRDDGLASQSPYLLGIANPPAVQPDTALSGAAKSSTDEPENAVQLASASPLMIQSQSGDDKDIPATPIAVATPAPAVQPDTALSGAANSSTDEPENAVQLAAASPLTTQSQPGDDKDIPATPIAVATPATASKTAEFAVASGAPRPNHESAGAETGFETLLAAAQVFNQSRAAEAHTPKPASALLPVHTPVGAHGWDGEVSDKLVWMVGRQVQHAELVLNPPQLGRVEVSLSINAGQASAQFVSANPAVRDALEAALPRLREALADAGVTLSQAQVGADAGNSGAANQSTNHRQNEDNSRRAWKRLDLANGSDGLRPVAATQWLRQANGLVDVFA